MNTQTLAVKPASVTAVLAVSMVVVLVWFFCAKLFGETISITMIVISAAFNWAIINFPRIPFHRWAVKNYRYTHALAGEHLALALAVIGLCALVIGQMMGFGVFYGAVTVMYILAEFVNMNRLSDDS